MIALLAAILVSLPTANDALLRPGGDADFFQPTVEGTTESGMFGCVRREGQKFHEGIDIKCRQRDRRGEPIDPVHAVADGEVAFVNAKPGLSNYGRYIVLAHQWDGVQVFTLYAHLRDVAAVAGQPVRRGQVIGTLGRSTNTREGISVDRAHLHFEINFMVNTGFEVWYPKREPKAPPFGNYNGKNLLGLDAAAFFRAYAGNRKLNFAEYVARQPIAFTVVVGARPFPWLAAHPEQMRGTNAVPVAYEIGVTAWGLPVAVWPRTSAGEQRGPVIGQVNETELVRSGCRRLIERTRRGWRFTADGNEWREMLTFTP